MVWGIMEDSGGSVGMGIPWGIPTGFGDSHGIFLWVWDGYGDGNPIPMAGLLISISDARSKKETNNTSTLNANYKRPAEV